ncbi:quinone-dependent dihydroorotate dehydrogenase [Wenyingzhuangia sp. IMCC45574]
MSLYKSIIRPIFFQYDPEKVHYFVFDTVKALSKIPGVPALTRAFYKVNHPKLRRELFGINFENPVGLAAGFDKNAVLFNELADYGFGFIEIGTVTPKGQEGNPKKRLFRLKEDAGIINRMGFNNLGVTEIVKNLRNNKGKVIIGGNIGKNTNIPTEQYTQDYCEVFEELHPHVDYFVLNVSCPNVSSHAKLEDKDYLLELVAAVQKINNTKKEQRPILLKIAPDLNHNQLDEIIELVAETKLDGVIASNTSVNREGLKATEEQLAAIGNGGLSGKPIKDRSTAVVKYLAEKSNKAFPIIGVGGIHSAEDALEKIKAGADLVQVYTGFIYEGPSLVKKINKAILKTL